MANNLNNNLKTFACACGIIIGITLASVVFINTHTWLCKIFRLIVLLIIFYFMFLSINRLLK